MRYGPIETLKNYHFKLLFGFSALQINQRYLDYLPKRIEIDSHYVKREKDSYSI